MPYDNKFWHKDAHGNIASPACLMFLVKLKIEDQIIRSKAA